jgi:hypothetical protein
LIQGERYKTAKAVKTLDFQEERRKNCEGKIISETDLRKVQSHQEKRKHSHYLRKSKA